MDKRCWDAGYRKIFTSVFLIVWAWLNIYFFSDFKLYYLNCKSPEKEQMMLLACDDLGTLLSAIFVAYRAFPTITGLLQRICAVLLGILVWPGTHCCFRLTLFLGLSTFLPTLLHLQHVLPLLPQGGVGLGWIKDRETQPNKITSPSKLTFLPHPTHYTLLLSPPCPLQMMKKEITSVLLILDFNEKDVLKARSSI